MIAISALLMIGFFGCTYVSQNVYDQNLNGITLQMSKDEVMEKIGKPPEVKTEVIQGKEYEVWRYPVKDLMSGKFNPPYLSYLEVRFLEGKVTQWKNAKIYAQPDYKLQQPVPEGEVKTFEFFKDKNATWIIME
jgi:hypothetical protein